MKKILKKIGFGLLFLAAIGLIWITILMLYLLHLLLPIGIVAILLCIAYVIGDYIEFEEVKK